MKISVKRSRGPAGNRPWKFQLVEVGAEGKVVGHFFYPANVELTADVILTEAWEHVLDPSIVENIELDATLRQLFVAEGDSELIPLLRRVILSGLLPLLETEINVDELMNRANQIGSFLLPCLNVEEFMATFGKGEAR